MMMMMIIIPLKVSYDVHYFCFCRLLLFSNYYWYSICTAILFCIMIMLSFLHAFVVY